MHWADSALPTNPTGVFGIVAIETRLDTETGAGLERLNPEFRVQSQKSESEITFWTGAKWKGRTSTRLGLQMIGRLAFTVFRGHYNNGGSKGKRR